LAVRVPPLLQKLAAGAAAALLLSGVAFWNGFPLVYPDTSLYLGPFAPSYRTPFYGLFGTVLHQNRTLWPVVLAQGVLAAWVLALCAQAVFGWTDARRFFALVVALCALSSLPWFTGQLMPDVFAGLLVVSLLLLGLARDRLARGERDGLLVLATTSVLFHQSHVFLALALAPVCALLARVRGLSPARALLATAAPALLAMPILVLVNHAVHGRAALSLDAATFYLANSIHDGPALATLERRCGRERWALCAKLDALDDWPWEEFLWNPEAPFSQAGGFAGLRDEARAIVWASLREDPAAHARAALRNAWRQLLAVRTGRENVSYLAKPYPTEHLRALFPRSFEAYARSRQSRGGLFRPGLARLHEIVLVASLAVSALCAARFARRGERLPACFLAGVVGALVANAALTGVVSGVLDRYQARVAWLLVLCAGAGVLALLPESAGARRASAGGSLPDSAAAQR
jgi:hypothetical protein